MNDTSNVEYRERDKLRRYLSEEDTKQQHNNKLQITVFFYPSKDFLIRNLNYDTRN